MPQRVGYESGAKVKYTIVTSADIGHNNQYVEVSRGEIETAELEIWQKEHTSWVAGLWVKTEILEAW
jgi:hypothetical protein